MVGVEDPTRLTSEEISVALLRTMAEANAREERTLPPQEAEFGREIRSKLLLAHAIIEGASVDTSHTHSLHIDFSGTNLSEVLIQAQHEGPRNASRVMLRIPDVAAAIRAAITKCLRAEIQGEGA